MGNSFLYFKTYFLLNGPDPTRITNPLCRLSLSLSMHHYLLGPMSHCGPPIGLHLSLWLGPRVRGKNSPIPHAPPLLRLAGPLVSILAPTLRHEPPHGSPRVTPPLPRCRTAVGACCVPPSRDGCLRRRGAVTVSYATPPRCPALVAT
jgi:hypothetical protein